MHVDFIKLNNIFRALMLCFLNCLSDHAIASPLSVDSDIEFSHRFIFLFFFYQLKVTLCRHIYSCDWWTRCCGILGPDRV